MSTIKGKFDLEEFIVTCMMMSLAGLVVMWNFVSYFPDSPDYILYLILAIIFTILAPALFVYLWLRKKKA